MPALRSLLLVQLQQLAFMGQFSLLLHYGFSAWINIEVMATKVRVYTWYIGSCPGEKIFIFFVAVG